MATVRIGKTVEITVRADPDASAAGEADWDAALQAVADLEDYDVYAWREQREYDA